MNDSGVKVLPKRGHIVRPLRRCRVKKPAKHNKGIESVCPKYFRVGPLQARVVWERLRGKSAKLTGKSLHGHIQGDHGGQRSYCVDFIF